MNVSVIILEVLIMFVLFALLVFGMLCISPLTFISDFPPEIQAEYYRSQHKEAAKQKLTVIMKIKKAIAVLVFLFVFAWMLHIAGAQTFLQGLGLAYLFIFLLFAWDTFFLDWVLFANIKRIRLPGTEHMEKEYHQKWFHVKVCIPVIPLFIVMGALSAFLMTRLW